MQSKLLLKLVSSMYISVAYVGTTHRRMGKREKEVLPVGQDVKDRPQDVTRKKENSLEGQR